MIAGPNEHNELPPSVDRIEEDFGEKPESVAADKAFGTGPNLEGMEERQVGFYTPVESPSPQPGNPALRDDPRQPVAEADPAGLPRKGKRKLEELLCVRRGDGHEPARERMHAKMQSESCPDRSTRTACGSTRRLAECGAISL
ncbi:MAG: hypothetical protein ACOX1P_07735 [Thermoguttaceae bacterium]